MPTTLDAGRNERRTERALTGRTVLICLVAFFGTIFAMNVVLVRVATSSFGGVETESSYKAGLTFKNDIAAAQAQDALHWAVDAALRKEGDMTRVTVTALDAETRPVAGLTVAARLSHPADRRQDVPLDLTETAAGKFEAVVLVPHGQWDLVLDLKRNDQTVFRSKNRVTR